MGVALIAWGRFVDGGAKVTVPAPNTDLGELWLWDLLALKVPDLRRAGFTALQAPPASKAMGGAGRGCDGYGVFDPRDLGTKSQQESIPTRYGSADSLRRMIACCHSVGVDVYLDVVLHQLSGENGGPGNFKYLGADGRTLNGRGAMQPGCFRGDTGNNDPVPPFRREDPVPVPQDDFPFGREKVYKDCIPPGYTISDAINFGDWLFRTTGADGMRFDDVKGTWAPFVAEFMRAKSMATKFAYSEYFDGNPVNLNEWATSAPMLSRSLVTDFTAHWAMQSACDSGNVAALHDAGYVKWNPFLSCTFVDNPDTDTSPGEQIISSKLLAYAFMLTIEGYPFVYAKDYFGSDVWKGAYGLKPWIDNLIWIHEKLAAGDTITRYLDDKVIVLNRTGGPGLLTALNFDVFNHRTITCETSFGPHTQLHDYTGRIADIWTDTHGNASFTVPPNAFETGQSYVCFSLPGLDTSFEMRTRSTTQTFFGADDLDIPPLVNGVNHIGRVYCETATEVNAIIDHVDISGSPGASILLEILAPGDEVVGKHSFTHGAAVFVLNVHCRTTGWHAFRATAVGLSDVISYELEVTYSGPRQLTEP
jgi:alpha-amylase